MVIILEMLITGSFVKSQESFVKHVLFFLNTPHSHFESELELGTFAKQVFRLLKKGFMWLLHAKKFQT